MADAENEEGQEEKKGGSLMLATIVGLLGIILGGGGVFAALSMGMGPQPAATQPPANQEVEAEPVSFDERVLSLDPFVVNVSGEGYPRYVKLQLAFELDSPEGRAELEGRVAQVRDLTILLLSSKRLADIDGFEGKALLKDDLRERVNAVLTKGHVESVLFTEFVIQ